MIKTIRNFIWKKTKEPRAFRRYMKYHENKCTYIWEHEPVWDGAGYHCPKCGMIFKPTTENIINE